MGNNFSAKLSFLQRDLLHQHVFGMKLFFKFIGSATFCPHKPTPQSPKPQFRKPKETRRRKKKKRELSIVLFSVFLHPHTHPSFESNCRFVHVYLYEEVLPLVFQSRKWLLVKYATDPVLYHYSFSHVVLCATAIGRARWWVSSVDVVGEPNLNGSTRPAVEPPKTATTTVVAPCPRRDNIALL